MTLPSDRLQLLYERHLELLVKFRTQLLSQSCYEDATEVDGLISELHSELENDSSLHESSINCTSNGTAVIHDAPSGPEPSISVTCPVMDSNSIIPKTACADGDLSSSQTHSPVNGHRIVAITTHETENKSSSTLNTTASNGSHQSATDVFDKSYYQDSLLPENVFHASNNNQEPGTVLLDADYHNAPLLTKDLNPNDLRSTVADPHHLVSPSGLSTQRGKYASNRVTLTVPWVYEDPTLFRGGG
ncbi:unnamed protein product [Schistosoma bovis]|nr:unnamed protein product [Schistosoma bovis]CAH8674634.1 unnamed protein product [Schistosoma bovis]